jgi:uncharacterized membrane protein
MIEQCIQLMQSMNMMDAPGGMMSSGMIGCWLGMGLIVLLLVGLVAAVVWLIWRVGRVASSVESPLEIAKRRYVRGEITAEQFETMKGQLKQ